MINIMRNIIQMIIILDHHDHNHTRWSSKYVSDAALSISLMFQVLSNMNVEELVDFVKVKDKLALNMMFTLLVVVATKLMAIMRTHYK